MTATPDGQGYWVAAADGGVFTFGDAQFLGSAGALRLNRPIIAMAATPDGLGYWLVASDGGIFTFGDAQFFGSTGSLPLNAPIVGMAPTHDGMGYWLVAADGGIFAFGDAQFFGSAGAIDLNRPIVAMTPTPDGLGYWLAATDGGIFSFGDAQFLGSAGSVDLNRPIVGIAPTPDGLGYWLVASDGGIFTFGDAQFFGSDAGAPSAGPAIAIAAAPGGTGYWVAYGDSPLDGAIPAYVAGRSGSVSAAVYDITTGESFDLNPGARHPEASIAKVNIMETLFRQLGDPAGYSSAIQGLLATMIEDSDNNSATSLFNDVGGAGGLAGYNRAIGLMQTALSPAWGLTTTSAEDQVALLKELVLPRSALTPEQRNYGLFLMEHITPSQAWGISGGVPPVVQVALKNGWLPLNGNGDWEVNSIGWVAGAGRDYLIAVLTTGDPSEGYGIDTIAHLAAHVWSAEG